MVHSPGAVGGDVPRYAHGLMSVAPRRIVTGHDAAGRSVVLSDAPTPRTLDIGTAAFHELEGETWLLLDDGSETRVGPGDAVVQRATNHAWANRSDRPVRMLFVLIDGAVADELATATGPLAFFDQVLG